MEYFINDSGSNKGTPHKSDGVNTRESPYVSKLSWLAHWKPSGTENASQDMSKLPTHSVRKKQTSDENLPQEPYYRKSGTSEADRPASKYFEQGRRKDEEEFVEVRPSLLLPGECIVARSIKGKRMEKSCDLVGGGPKTTTLPSRSKLALANQSPVFKQLRDFDGQRKISGHAVSPFLFPSSNAKFISLDTQPPTLYRVLKGCQKTTDRGAASSASSPPHATDTSFSIISACKAKTWPLAVRECSGQESNVSKACNARLEGLADQSHQVKHENENESYNFFDSTLDSYKFIESASVAPTHGRPKFESNTSSFPPFICSEDGNSQRNFRETHGDHIMCTHSALRKNKKCDCENKQRQDNCCFTFLNSEKKISMAGTGNEGNSGSENKFTSPVVGDFLFSRGEGKFKLNFSDTGFSGSKTGTPKDAKIAEIPDTTISNAVPACSLRDLETVRICTTVDKIQGIPGGPSKFSKTTHHFLITKKTGMAFNKEDQLIERSTADAKFDQNSFLQFFGLSPSFCPLDTKDTRMKPTSCGTATAGLLNDYTHGHRYRSSDIAEETSTFQQARESYLKSVDYSEIHTEDGDLEASFGQTSPQLDFKDNFTCKNNADSVEEMTCLVRCIAQASSVNVKHESSSETEQLDLNIFMTRDSKGVAFTSVNKDHVEAEISCDPLERTTLARTEPSRNDVSPSCSAMGGCEDRKGMCASRTQSFDAEDLPAHADQPDPSQSDFSHADRHPSSRWVKRLKHSHLETFGTKRSVDGDIYFHDKKIKLFSKVLNYGRSISNSELSSACIEKQQRQLVETVILPRQRRSSLDLMRQSRDILSDPWIQRWCTSAKGGGIQISSAEVICEPECSKISIIEMQGKEFPSLGAMALMGKALTNFRPCELRRMGPFVVWQTKGH